MLIYKFHFKLLKIFLAVPYGMKKCKNMKIKKNAFMNMNKNLTLNNRIMCVMRNLILVK